MTGSTNAIHPAPGANGCGSTLTLLKRLLAHPLDDDLWSEVAARHLHVRIGRDPPSTQTAHSLDMLRRFIEHVEFPTSPFCEVWKRRETIFAETEVLLRNEPGLAVPCVIIVRTRRGRIMDIRIYGDIRVCF